MFIKVRTQAQHERTYLSQCPVVNSNETYLWQTGRILQEKVLDHAGIDRKSNMVKPSMDSGHPSACMKDFQNLKTVIEFKKYGSLVTHWVLKGQSKQQIKLNSISFHQYTTRLAATAVLVVQRFNLCNPQSRQILYHLKYSQI